MLNRSCSTLLVVLTCGLPSAAVAQRPDAQATMAAQRDAMKQLTMLDGIWRGPARIIGPAGERHEITQTERIGSFLDGSIKVIEGRGYEQDGTVSFNAFAVVSYDPKTSSFSMRSYAQGSRGDFPLRPTVDGFVWEITGPVTIRYTTTIKDGKWHEVGDRIMPGGEVVRFIEMDLVRVGDTDWPQAGGIGREP
jgi:hypothetical protein